MTLDNSLIGKRSKEYIVDVERRHIRQFAEAIGDDNPLYDNDEYASNTIFEGIIAPLTFPIALSDGADLPLDLDHRRMLHGEQEFIYERPVRLGDKLYCQTVVKDIYEREGRSGNMQFLILDTEMKDEDGNLVVTSRMNIIYRELKS